MSQDLLFFASCALVLFVRLAYDAWKRRRLQRALAELAEAAAAVPEVLRPRGIAPPARDGDCVPEGLGPRFEPKLTPSPVTPFGALPLAERELWSDAISADQERRA